MRCLIIFVLTTTLPLFCFAQQQIPKGTYLELFYGAKSGGGSNHHQLVSQLKSDYSLQGFEFFCINGRDRTATSNEPGFAIDRERRLPPVLAKNCKGSAAVLMGPIDGENVEVLVQYLEKNYLHLYSDLRRIP
jgi:hypothetical protein